MVMPKSREIWSKLEEAKNTHKESQEYRKIQEEITAAEVRLKYCESMDEYDSISNEIEGLKRNLKEVEIQLRIKPVQERSIRKKELMELPSIYNEEFKPYYDKYLELNKELNKNLKKFALEVDPIVKRMEEIEKLERSFAILKMQVVENNTPFLKLPVDNSDLMWQLNVFEGMSRSLTSSVEKLINKIKRKNRRV